MGAITAVAPPKDGAPLAVALKLQQFTSLSAEEHDALRQISRNTHIIEPRRDLIHEGDRPRYVHLVISGWGCRYKTLPDGKRQIVGLFLPGDFCDLNVYILRHMDHNIGAITRLKVARIAPDELESLTARYPRITQALLWHELVMSATEREWLLNVGQRSAYERLAHLLVEVFLRLRSVKLTVGGTCDFPLTQTDLGDASGLTPVHVNRMLQELRSDNLIELGRKQLRILDLDLLMAAAMYNPNYLHLDHEGRHLNANA